MIDYILVAWFFFCIGFSFSFTDIGVRIKFALLAELDKILPKKKGENK